MPLLLHNPLHLHGTIPILIPRISCSTATPPRGLTKRHFTKTQRPTSPPTDSLNLKSLTSRVVQLTRRRQLAQIFEEIEIAKNQHGKLNIIVMNAVMEACVHCHDIESALRLFAEMSEPEGCGVDDVTYGTLLKGLGNARRIDEAFQVLESVEQGTAVGRPRLSGALICGLLNSLIEADSGTQKGYKYLKCNFCAKEIKGGVKRVKEHLACTRKDVAACSKVPEDVKREMSDYLKAFTAAKHSRQMNFKEMVDGGSYFESFGGDSGIKDTDGIPTGNSDRGVRGPMDRYLGNVNDGDGQLPPAKAKELRNLVCLDIGRFFYENGIPFHVATSASFHSMMQSAGNYGRGLKLPSMHELRTWILDEEKKTTEKTVDDIKATWKKTGVSILSDGWSDIRNRSLINFLVNNQHGTVFLKTVDASDCVKDAQKLFQLLDDVVEEVGEENVIQVVTDNASNYKAAGRLLMEKRSRLYWTPCAAHCIDLMLEKLGELPQHKNALLKAKRVSNFIHNHQWVLAFFREIAKKDLIRPAATRFATAYLTLESMQELKQPLQSMVVSRKWEGCAWAKKAEGKEIKKIIMSEKSFWSSVDYCIRTTKPLVEVLRIVDGEKTPAMGFIYGAMDEAKEKIAMNLNGNEASYKEIWDIIDEKWNFQLHRDLHAAGYYLNPRYRWSDSVSTHPEIKRGLYKCMERLVPDDRMYSKVDEQLDEYNGKKGLFSIRAAQNSYLTRPPVTWWDNFGDDVPELKSFAMRILGLTCSASACERNWSTFNQVHTKKRNRLTTSRLNDLVYIMYNRKLKYKHLKAKERKEEVDPLVVDDVPSDDSWVVDPNETSEDDEEMHTLEVESSSAQRKRKRGGKEIALIDDDEDDGHEVDDEDDEDV